MARHHVLTSVVSQGGCGKDRTQSCFYLALNGSSPCTNVSGVTEVGAVKDQYTIAHSFSQRFKKLVSSRRIFSEPVEEAKIKPFNQEDLPLVEFAYFVFTLMPGTNYRQSSGAV